MESAAALIDEKIKELGDWRGKTLAKVRELIHKADPEIVHNHFVPSCHLFFDPFAVAQPSDINEVRRDEV
jgi:hypothetical protein